MEEERIKPRVLHGLRSVMLAGAGAVLWLALSSAAANADSGDAPNHTIPGEAGSAVTNVLNSATEGLSGTPGKGAPVSVAPAPAAVPALAPPAQRPAVPAPTLVVSELPRLAQTVDRIVASTPVVNSIVPQGTVGSATAPVTSPVVGAATGGEKSVGTLTGNIVAPTLDAVGATVVALPAATPAILETVPALGMPGIGANGILPGTQAAATPMANRAKLLGPSGLGESSFSGTVRYSRSGTPSVPLSPSDGTFPGGALGSGAGAVGSAAIARNALGAAAAWLPGINLFAPLAGGLVSTAAAGKIPAPMSFEPGSSPD